MANHFKLMLLRDERIEEHWLETAELGLPDNRQRKNEVYM